MSHHNPSDDELRRLLTDASTIAMVGASSKPDKDSYGIMQKLQRAGYKVIPVNPRETEILGERAFPSLLDIPCRSTSSMSSAAGGHAGHCRRCGEDRGEGALAASRDRQ
jgi:hypothetical protein